jgi:membrane associated rhomboid family serine protease
VLVLLTLMWLQEVADATLGLRLDRLGVEPREADGLVGVALAPFLHVGFAHLAANTVPFLVLGALVALSGLARLLTVTAVVTLVSGLGVWLLAPSGSLHLGASGVVFGYATYLISRGVFERRLRYLAVGAVVALLYGGMLLGGLLPRAGVSWQGHLFGAVAGVLAAWLLARPHPGRHRYRV